MNVLAARLKALEGRTTGQGPCPEHRARAEDRPRSYRDGLDAFLPFPEDGARPAAAGGRSDAAPPCPRCAREEEPAFDVATPAEWGAA